MGTKRRCYPVYLQRFCHAVKAKKNFAQEPGDWKTLVQNSDGTIQADSGRFEITQLPLSVSNNIKDRNITEPVKNATDNSSYVLHMLLSCTTNVCPRNFEDARGFVINDYQSFLEDKWIDSTEEKIPGKSE